MKITSRLTQRGRVQAGHLAILATILGVTALFAPAANATTTASSPAADTTHTKVVAAANGDMGAGSVISIPGGKHVTLPKDWSQMTVNDLAAIGITPGMGTAGPKTTYAAPGAITPQSAYGCSGWVCINIIGSGLHVSSWSTKADLVSSTCSFAVYWAPTGADVLDTGTTVCGDAGGSFYGTLTYPLEFNFNSHVCNTWVSISGKPCEYIHS